MSNKSWNSGTSYELSIYKIIMWPLGIWPLNRGEVFSEVRLLLAAMTQAATFICLDIEMWNNCRGLEDILDIFVLSIFSLLACVKGLLARYHQDEIYSNVSSAIDDWYALSIIDNSNNRKIMMKHARIGRIVCISLMAPASTGTLSWIILALPLPIFAPANSTDAIRNFPLQTACTFESFTTSTIYYVIFIVQIYQLIATCLGNCGNDVFFFGLGMHICGQLEILKNEFRTFVDVDKMTTDRKRFQLLVRRHTHLMDLVENLEESFNLIILSQLVMSGLLICIMGIQVIIALKIGDLFSGINAGVVLSSLMSQLFLYSYGGDYLTSQNEDLAFAAYESMWYTWPVNTMKDIGFVIFRAGKPINITAGKFVQMTLATFMDILKLAVSYIKSEVLQFRKESRRDFARDWECVLPPINSTFLYYKLWF
uniref:Odorant receptor n=1 Tax=Meteorus pulchricornis TaxID=51522 RepID=A0A1S5VFJ3_9HYME|nr:olfactory receptor 4 [Meteorus pulchricornis]